MKKLLVAATLCSLVFSGQVVNAQSKVCGTDIAIQNMVAQNPQLQVAYEQYEKDVAQRVEAYAMQTANSAQKTTATITLPVVFHVVLSQAQINEIGGTTGITDRITSQIAVLNRDFNGQNYTADEPRILPDFKSRFGNAGISFGLAHTKAGGGTSGIEYKIAAVGFTGFDVGDNGIKQTQNGGLSPWDNTKFINIWITHITTSVGSGQVLGYAYNPGLAKAMGDASLAGVVVDYKAFGKRTSFNQVFFGVADGGRTMVHELGHYFTLNHIWGNTSPGVSPSCADDDGVTDTPPQNDANQSTCYSIGTVRPNCTSTAGGEMYMNYMDYVQDACMVMFSKGQAVRMQSELSPTGGSYNIQFNGDALNWPTGVSNVDIQNSFDIIPNPSTGLFNIAFYQSAGSLRSVTVVNMMGQSVKQIAVTEQKDEIAVDLSGMPKGMYMVNCQFEEGIVTKKIVLQ